MKTTSIQIRIDNPAKIAWEHFTDYDFHPNWNLGFKNIEPVSGTSNMLIINTKIPDFPNQYFLVRIDNIIQFRELDWYFYFPLSDELLFRYRLEILSISDKNCLINLIIYVEDKIIKKFGDNFLISLNQLLINQGSYLRRIMENNHLIEKTAC